MAIFKKKRYESGSVQRFLQTFDVDFIDKFTPVARGASFRVIYSLSVYFNLIIGSMDMDVATLNITLQEYIIYIDPSASYSPIADGMVLKRYKISKVMKYCVS